jgi:3'-5' exoribonuclease
MAKNGRSYMTLKLMDATGEVEGRIWDRVEELSEQFDKDDFLQVAGKASVYMGKMQLVIQQLERVDESRVDIADFLPVTDRRQEEMLEELTSLINTFEEPYLKSLMQSFQEDSEFMACYTRAPAAKSMHHAYLGGLLEHSLAVAALAQDISKRYPDLQRDLLIVGALLHDVGKIAELRYQRSFEYTDAGKLLGHIMIGVELLDEKIRQVDGFPEELAVHLKHLLLSHHGQYEYGSPKRPKTIEAVILNFIDDLDSKINGVRTHIDREPDRKSSWTQYHKMYDRYFYKGPSSSQDSEDDEGTVSAPVKEEAKRPREDRSHFSHTLGEQLLSKNPDLLKLKEQGQKDE